MARIAWVAISETWAKKIMPPLPIKSNEEQYLIIRSFLQQKASARSISILEAGCGRKWDYDIGPESFAITGVDTDIDALKFRRDVEQDLDEAIIGDLRDVEFPDRSFDVIYNAFVLEHIQGAESVLNKFASWLKPDGLLILFIPDRDSAYGFITRLTPHWLHVAFYRYVLGSKNAGQPGFGPYPAYYDRIVSRDGILDYAARTNMRKLSEFGYFRLGGLCRNTS